MLLGNGSVLHKLPLKYYGGSTTSVEPQLVNNFDKSGPRRNRILIDQRTTALNFFAVPTGYYAQTAWFLPQKAGEISSHEFARATFTPAATVVGGVTTNANATMVFTVADLIGQLISSGSGTASMSITAANLLLTGSVSGAGSSAFSIATNTPILGALAGGYGAATMTFNGTLVPYAIGNIIGSTLYGGALSEASIASAVWSTVAASYNETGTMGAKLNGAGSAGNPWTEVIESGLTAAQVLRIVASAMAGKVSGAGTGTETFKGLDGTTNRIVSTVDNDGNRTSVAVNGA